MKPTSIIFLIFSVVLVIAGFCVCGISEDMAIKDDYDLFVQEVNESGDLITTIPISREFVSKLVVNLTDANIQVVGNADEARIELVNYPINTFTNKLANGIMTIDDNVNLLTLFNLTGQGTQFLGLRHYFKNSNFGKGEKTVNVYLTEEIELQEMEISVDQANISVTNCDACNIYKLNSINGDVSLSNVTDSEKVEIIVRESGNASVQHSAVSSVIANVSKGTCSYVALQPNVQSYTVNTAQGMIYVDGLEYGTSYTSSSATPEVNCTFNVQEGNVMITELK